MLPQCLASRGHWGLVPLPEQFLRSLATPKAEQLRWITSGTKPVRPAVSRVSRTLRFSSTSRAIPSESGDSKGGAVTLDNNRNEARAPRGVSRFADTAVKSHPHVRSN